MSGEVGSLVLKRVQGLAAAGHWAGKEGERGVAAGGMCGLVGLGLQWGLELRPLARLRGRPAHLWQEQEGVRGEAILLYGDVIHSGGKKFRQQLKNHAFQALVPLLLHLADSCPDVVMVSGLACLRLDSNLRAAQGQPEEQGWGGPSCLQIRRGAQDG